MSTPRTRRWRASSGFQAGAGRAGSGGCAVMGPRNGWLRGTAAVAGGAGARPRGHWLRVSSTRDASRTGGAMAASDVIIGRGGDSLMGTVLNKEFRVKTKFGNLTLARPHVAWIHFTNPPPFDAAEDG